MNIQNKKICFISYYGAQYAGNFILMLLDLAKRLQVCYNVECFFIFNKQSDYEWHRLVAGKHQIEFVDSPYARSCVPQITNLLRKWDIDLVHYHFEAYDIPVAKAVKQIDKNIKQVWHLHDYVEVDKSGKSFEWLRKIRAKYLYFNHYRRWGKDAYLVGVSAEVLYSVEQFRDNIFAYPKQVPNEELSVMSFKHGCVLINGIDMRRLNRAYKIPGGIFTFLTFGGDTFRKGIPLIFDACELLYKDRKDFRLVITKGVGTEDYCNKRYERYYPEWLSLVNQSDDIAALFDKSHCFISASHRETMSMAIAEASIYGLPVIQSDIPGTWWNVKSPSAFVFRDNDASYLKNCMEKLINMDKETLKDLCAEGAMLNRKRLSLESWTNSIIDIYKNV